MQKIKVILMTLVVCAMFIGTAVFTACNKVTCSNIVCLNGGTCSSGKCTCPAGFSGVTCNSKATTAISYRNNAFTPITIAVNGVAQTIPVGGSVAFTGQVGTLANAVASTTGASSLGISSPSGTIGLTIDWQLNNAFPASDTLRVPMDVGSSYFFLRMVNKEGHNVINYYVNVGFPDIEQYFQDVTVPSDGNTYDLGYYLAYSSSNVQTQTSDSKVIWKAVVLPLTNNQAYTVVNQ